ncbi:uncharacterized protein LOC105691726 [Athalia rosae]|uniref:uncharacterized protein LOC105691726 n=1 Tax=Athalia rosae TaxID=37344 RepID=UPI0020347651|nr:uncharacterized protein LOC105691726 [Athalia rosae]
MTYRDWTFLIFALAICVKAQQGYRRENPANQLEYNESGFSSNPEVYGDEDASDVTRSSGEEIPGEAGKDYPIFADVPKTGFECVSQRYPGYYADEEAGCQVFHICQNGGRMDSFLCPNGTIFNQEKLVCDWWFNFDCARARNFYSVNEAVVRAMEEADRILAERRTAEEGYRYGEPSGPRKQQGSPSSSNVPESDFDTVVVEAARKGPSGSQRLTPRAEDPARHDETGRQKFENSANGYATSKDSQITAATFGNLRGNAEDTEVIQDQPRRDYLPTRFRTDQY